MSAGFYLVSSVFYLNMSAEIMFVLANRIKAQKIDMTTVGSKILCDITLLMYKPSFIDNILKPQNPLSISTQYEIFNKIVNSSHMKLDKSSMEKLFFLILMTFKKQIFLISSPLQLYTLTLTHLQDVTKIQKGNNQSIQCVRQAIQKFKKQSEKWNYMHYMEMKEEILSTLQNYKSRIVLFCETGTQDQNGNLIFIPRNTHNRKQIGLCQNNQNMEFQLSQEWGKAKNIQYSQYKNWKTNLGKDDYDNVRGSSKVLGIKENTQVFQQNNRQLSELLGIKKMKLDNFQISLDIFSSNSTVKKVPQNLQANTEKVKPSKGNESKMVVQQNDIKKKIDKQFDDLGIQDKKQKQEQIDLLDLMDS